MVGPYKKASANLAKHRKKNKGTQSNKEMQVSLNQVKCHFLLRHYNFVVRHNVHFYSF